MTDERNPDQQAGGLTEKPIGPQNLIADELEDNSQPVSASEYTPGDSSEEVATPELSSGDVSTSEVSSDEVVTPENPLEDKVDQPEPEVETVPEDDVCNYCDTSDPYGLKSDPGCDLPLCKPDPEEPEDNQETQAEELPLSSQDPLEENNKTQENSLESQEGEVLEEQEDLEDPCAVPEEPVCDFPKPSPEAKEGVLTDEELEGQEIVDDNLIGVAGDSSAEGSPEESSEKSESEGEVPLDQEPEIEEEVEIAVDPCGPRDPCGFQIDAACIAHECNDASLQSEIEGANQVDANCINPVDEAPSSPDSEQQKDSGT